MTISAYFLPFTVKILKNRLRGRIFQTILLYINYSNKSIKLKLTENSSVKKPVLKSYFAMKSEIMKVGI